jgi:hypothetical protein
MSGLLPKILPGSTIKVADKGVPHDKEALWGPDGETARSLRLLPMAPWRRTRDVLVPGRLGPARVIRLGGLR